MDSEFEHLSLEFTRKAQKLFTFTFENFRDSIKGLNRRKDENVFQLQVAKFLATLKKQLESIAQDLISKNQHWKNIDKYNKVLKDNIDLYLNEFRQKSRSI